MCAYALKNFTAIIYVDHTLRLLLMVMLNMYFEPAFNGNVKSEIAANESESNESESDDNKSDWYKSEDESDEEYSENESDNMSFMKL